MLWCADVVLCRNLHITFVPVSEISFNDIILALKSLKAWITCGWRCVQHRFFWDLHLDHNSREKSYCFQVVATFWNWGRGFIILDCSSMWNLCLSFWTRDKKTFHGMAPPRRKNSVFATMLGQDISLLGLWGGDSWECDCQRWDSLFWCLHQYAERTHGSISDHFILTRIWQKSCFSMTVPGCTQVRRLGKPLCAVVGQCYFIHPAPAI